MLSKLSNTDTTSNEMIQRRLILKTAFSMSAVQRRSNTRGLPQSPKARSYKSTFVDSIHTLLAVEIVACASEDESRRFPSR